MTINYSLFESIFSVAHINPILDSIVVFFAAYLPYFAVFAFLWFLFITYRADWRARLMFFGESALAVILSRGILTEAIRIIVPNPRPNAALHIEALLNETSSSFPSAHAATFFVLAMTLWFFNKNWSRWFFAFALINGIARIAAGVHWPFDILGGIGVGMISALLIHELVRPYWEALSKKKTPAI